MRKVLIASAVALVLFAVGAFAATFIVNADDIASGEDEVLECADTVNIDWPVAEGTYDVDANDWPVPTAELTFLDDASATTPTDDCDGFDLTLVVEDVGGAVISESGGTISGGTATVTLDAGVFAGDIGHAAVLVNGVELTPGTSTP